MTSCLPAVHPSTFVIQDCRCDAAIDPHPCACPFHACPIGRLSCKGCRQCLYEHICTAVSSRGDAGAYGQLAAGCESQPLHALCSMQMPRRGPQCSMLRLRRAGVLCL